MKVFTFIALSVFTFSGCSVLGIGDVTESTCDGECSFKETGVCADAISIYTHRKELENRKVKENWFSEDQDPYLGDSNSDSSFVRINEEDLNDN